MRGTVTDAQQVALIRAAALIGRHGECLADFERELVEECVLRFRDQGAGAVLTDNEWRVFQEAVGAMDAVAEDAQRTAWSLLEQQGRQFARDMAGVLMDVATS